MKTYRTILNDMTRDNITHVAPMIAFTLNKRLGEERAVVGDIVDDDSLFQELCELVEVTYWKSTNKNIEDIVELLISELYSKLYDEVLETFTV